MSERLLKTLRKSGDFQAEYEGSIPFTRLNVFGASLRAPDFVSTSAAAFHDLFQQRKKATILLSTAGESFRAGSGCCPE